MKCAIATVAIGENHQSAYAAIFKPSVERYVARHGYDLFVFNDYIGNHQHRDPSLISLMPLMIPYHEAVRSHDLLMVLDVDVLINSQTPPFHALDLGARVGVVDEWCQPSHEERITFQVINGLETTTCEYYRLAGFAMESETLINGGMFICAPRVHGEFFRNIVERHIETQRSHPRGAHFEQAMFGYELQKNDLVHLLPIAWNRLWPQHRHTVKLRAPARTAVSERWSDLKRFREVFDASFLLHMTGGLDHDLAFLSRKVTTSARSHHRREVR